MNSKIQSLIFKFFEVFLFILNLVFFKKNYSLILGLPGIELYNLF